jgi:hypothetical protein
MADKMYAWSTIVKAGEHPSNNIKAGSEVSASDFDDEAEFDELASIGAIRPDPYPIPGDVVFEGSPREYLLQKAAEMGNADYDLYSPPQMRDPATQGLADSAMDEAGIEPDVPAPADVDTKEAQESSKPKSADTAKAGLGKDDK